MIDVILIAIFLVFLLLGVWSQEQYDLVGKLLRWLGLEDE